ncbi:MAG: hypothetical protein HQK96_03615 [Nitrospirae bacterium]|nr:hypothetical protein [Nitrospirota bacterium]
MSVIAIPKPLREKLGDEATDSLIKVLNDAESTSRKDLATKEDLAKLETKLVEKIGDTKAETLKWMFIFWAGQLAAMFVMFKSFIK